MEEKKKKGKAGKFIAAFLVLLLAGGIWYFFRGGTTKGPASGSKETQQNQGGSKKDDMDMSSISMDEEKKTGEKKLLYWVDPMHPAYKSDKPGKAPDCGMDLVPVYEGETGGTGSTASSGSVMISSEKQQMIGVTYGVVTSEPLMHTIFTVGRVTYNETKIIKINTKIEGWIDKVYVDFTGQLVKKGQPLISIYSPELVSTEQEYLLALKAKETLFRSSFKEIASGSDSLLAASKKRLLLWDITEEQIKKIEEKGEPIKSLTLYAPESGFVLEKNAFEQRRVTPETDLYAIANLSTVWVIADVYEYEIPMIKIGQQATMNMTYFPGEIFNGRVSYIYPQLDNATRTLKVRLEFPNPGFKLKPDMYANVNLKIDYGKQVSVPEEAVLDSGNEQIVFVAREEGRFEPRKVRLGAKVDKRFIILGGLAPGEKIVTSANFLIDSESKLKSAMGGMAGMPEMGQEAKLPAAKEQKTPNAPAAPRSKQKQEEQKMPPMPGM